MSGYNRQLPSAELVCIDHDKGSYRFYYADLWPDLFGGVSIMREFGRIGQPGTLKLDSYTDPDQAEAALHKIVRRKKRKGYRELGE